MDPHRNFALHSAKIRTILQSQNTSRATETETDDMPAPPAYHMVVDPHAPVPNVRSPYDAEEEEDKYDDETPEITINAATQVRGNGNIISIAQMDSGRIANLIAIMLNGGKLPEPTSPALSPTQSQSQPPHPTQTQTQLGLNLPPLSSLTLPHKPKSYRINITVNCGATVIGDRNIVGPGLGDIARQMQLAQRNHALHAQQQAQQQAAQGQRSSPTAPSRETLYQAQASIAQHHGLFGAQPSTPPMSRSSSWQSDGSGGVKRKAEHDVKEGAVKKQR